MAACIRHCLRKRNVAQISAILAVCAVLQLASCSVPLDASVPTGEPSPPPPPPLAPEFIPDTPLQFACDPSAGAEPDQLRRLTTTQYKNTIVDLVRWVLDDPVEAERTASSIGLERVPVDRREPAAQATHGGFRRLDQAVDQAHVDETLRVATTLAATLTSPARLGRVAGACAVDADAANDEMCLSTFIRRFGARALRRPLDADEESYYRAVYGGDPTASAAAYADVIAVMLSAPQLLYFVEHGEAEVLDQPGQFELSPYELASRLSYHFWQTLPDEELWRSAEDRSLLQPEVLTQQVARLLADPRARATIAELFSDYLALEELPAPDAQTRDPLVAAFAGDDLPGPELRQHIIDEALDLLAYYTWTAPGGVEELYTSELSFARDADLARIYGVEPWDGASMPPALAAGERVGLLTRAWFLVGSTPNTRPIMRGVFVRRHLLCDDIPPPPGNVNAFPPEPRSDMTTREVIEDLTEQPRTACASCHATWINPIGFAFEGFDALARTRTVQPLFGRDGTQVGARPVDTTTVPRVTPDDTRRSTGPTDLTHMMLRSGKLEACLARNYFRFTFGRYEDLQRDGCALERLRARLVESGRIRDMLEEAALLPTLRRRRFEVTP